MVGPVFEKEVNVHLKHNLQSCLPSCRISDIRSRQVEKEDGTGTLCEIDSFGYVFEDDLMYGKELPTSGVFLVTPNDCGQKKAIKAKQKMSHSPGAQDWKQEKMAEKYIIGESYSGQSEETVAEKVHTLEDRIGKMISHFKAKHSKGLADDITCAVGAVLLCFSSGAKERNDARIYFSNIIYREMSPNETPYLWRLAAARRCYLLVLANIENPQATSLREIVGISESTQLSLQSLEETVAEGFERMNQGFKAMGVATTDSVKDRSSAAVTTQRAKTVPRNSKKK